MSLNISVQLKQGNKDEGNTGDGTRAECYCVLRQSEESCCGLS